MDGNLTAKLREHLAECGSCRHAYESFNAAVMMLDEIPEVDPPADFHASVMARLERARRTAPQPVRWWTVDWQRVFTIRVPARGAAMAAAVVLLFALAFQFSPVRTTVAGWFTIQKPASAPVTNLPEDAPGVWEPYNSGEKGELGLTISIAEGAAGIYSVRLGTKSGKPVAFEANVGSAHYSGSVVAKQESAIQVAAPAVGSVAVVGIAWSLGERGRYQSIFLPAKLERKSAPRSFRLESVKVLDVLRRISSDYGVAIIASGDLAKPVAYAQVDDMTPGEALYYCLNNVGMKSRALASSVFAVEPIH